MTDLMKLMEETAPITVGSGTLSGKMNKGSFAIKDRIRESRELPLVLKEPDAWRYSYASDTVVLRFSSPENGKILITFETSGDFNRLALTLKSHPEEHFYGCGEQFTHLDLKGQKVKIWVSEHQNSRKITKKCIREKLFGVNPDHRAKYSEHQTYIAAPSFLSGDGYFVDCDSDGYAEFSFEKDRTILRFTEIPRKITIVAAENFYRLMEKVSSVTGKSRKLPEWVGDGAILAVQGGEDRLLLKLGKCRRAGVRVAGIWCQDWSGQIKTQFGTQVYWNWQPDEHMYSKELIDTLHAEGIRFLGYINPYLKRDTALYQEAVAAGYAIQKADGSVYHVKSTTFDAAMVDLTNPEAYEWYKNIIKNNLIGFGLDGWMADFGEYLPPDAVLWADTNQEEPANRRKKIFSGESAWYMHNVWSALWQKCNREAIRECGREGDIFTFNRAAYRGTVPYTNSFWNGDQHVDWSDEYGLGSVIPATLSLACIGMGVCHSDIGGYTTIMHMKRSSELFLRWAELSVFTPVFRCHEGNRPEENIQFDDETVLAGFAKLSGLFANLKSYRDHVLQEYEDHGLPVNRPIFFAFSEEWCYHCQTEFLFGNDVLVTPVLREKTAEKEVRLPEGQWIRFFTGEEYGGGEVRVRTPLGMPVAFYRKESVFSELFSSLVL